MRKIRIGECEKEIIKQVAEGTLVISSIFMPGVAQILKPYIKDKYRQKRLINNLERKGLISISNEEVNLTSHGKYLLNNLTCEEIEIVKGNRWDRIWHVVIYDIPNEKNRERSYFRMILRKLGFIKIQKSVWVIPWECREEVAIIAHQLKLSNFVLYLKTDHLPNQRQLELRFSME